MVYNKSRNNLFATAVSFKETKGCVAQGRPRSISAPRHLLFEKQLVTGKWKYLKSSRFSLDISMKMWQIGFKKLEDIRTF